MKAAEINSSGGFGSCSSGAQLADFLSCQALEESIPYFSRLAGKDVPIREEVQEIRNSGTPLAVSSMGITGSGGFASSSSSGFENGNC